MLIPLPTNLPPEAWQIAADALRGNVPSKAVAVDAVWNVAGFGAQMIVGSGGRLAVASATMATEQAGAMTAEQAAVHCESAANDPQGLIPWGLLLPIILQLLTKLLG